MLHTIPALLAKIFGTKSEKDIKGIMPIVDLTNEEFVKLHDITDEELREKTDELRSIIQERTKEIEYQQTSLKEKIQENSELSLPEKEEIFKTIDTLEKEKNVVIETVLEEIMPRAFAIVKETARRFAENKELVVNATDFDRKIARTKKNIIIEGEKAIWKNQWIVASNTLIWNMVHYDVQLIGGVALHRGKVAEMSTGEGKTLVATLPAYLNALVGKGIHIVTVNDYLAKRDCEWNAPLFEFHKMRVDCIDKYPSHTPERQEAYRADIIYGTNNEFGFDYLRDNMARTPEDMVQRVHHFAMVDEVDSVLIDEARTPLIISGPVPKGSVHKEFNELKPRVLRLVEEQEKLCRSYLNDAKKLMDSKPEEAGLSLFRAFRGLPKYKPLIKYLSEPGIRAILKKTEGYYLQDNQKEMPKADEPLFFKIDERHSTVELTDKGLEFITQSSEEKDFFILPNVGEKLSEIEKKNLDDIQKQAESEKVIQEYQTKSQKIHTITQLLKAYTLFEKDVEYVLAENKVQIVDEQTGRVLSGRRYSDGLHQAIEAKENVTIEESTQTYATITLQNYFRMYHKLAGMTGTAETEAAELWDIYKLDVVVIPTNVPTIRKDIDDQVYKTTREKFNAVISEIKANTEKGRPVLVGTTSVEISELLSKLLSFAKMKHQVLNAKQHQREAEIIAEAGKPGTVTIATNMAGRGTDIKLTPESRAAGGLAIIGTERHESRRVDRQLRGRAGRQGDPGSSKFFVSLEDTLMRLFGSDRLIKWMDRMKMKEGEVLEGGILTRTIANAQKKVEENNFSTRKRLLEYDNVMNSQREIVYSRRKNALFGEKLEMDILHMIYDVSEDIVNRTKQTQSYTNFKIEVQTKLAIDPHINVENFENQKPQQLIIQIYKQTLQAYTQKKDTIKKDIFENIKQMLLYKSNNISDITIPFTNGKKQLYTTVPISKILETKADNVIKEVEKFVTLSTIDELWKEHLRDMDDLKQSVQNVVYEQKDPLLVYKFESFEMFKSFLNRMNEENLSFLTHFNILTPQEGINKNAIPPKNKEKLKEIKTDADTINRPLTTHNNNNNHPEPPQNKEEPTKTTPVKSQKIADRNQKITVRYLDGTIKKDVKYKNVEEDIQNKKCTLI
ncbi:MAG: preprotein translocase subunit SecA [Chitinophagaceae bacterium]|nr:preprotein translocase subunit SecA [Chitinophagaceae bacterium]